MATVEGLLPGVVGKGDELGLLGVGPPYAPGRGLLPPGAGLWAPAGLALPILSEATMAVIAGASEGSRFIHRAGHTAAEAVQ